MTLYARVVDGKVVQESVHRVSLPIPGELEVLAVRAAGVEEIRREIAERERRSKRHAEELRFVLRLLGLPEEEP